MRQVFNKICKMTALMELAFGEKRSINTNLRVGKLVAVMLQ